jgi:polyisoprenoid-binding protein YceI
MVISNNRKYFLVHTGLWISSFFFVGSASGQFHPVASESAVQFTIRNFGFKVSGSLAAPQGDIQFKPDSLSNSFFHISIRAESINTDNNSRDDHLKKEEYFDVNTYPLIRFVSGDIHTTGKNGAYEAVGMLTIKNTSREIHLPFTAEKNGTGWLFSGSFKMNRRDFNVGGSSTLSNDVEVAVKVLAR